MKNKLKKWHDTRLFSPLLRNNGASFPHALGSLPVGNTLAAIRAVFDVV
jgi:hypothetical protein